MKNIFFKTTLCLLLLGSSMSCSNDDAVNSDVMETVETRSIPQGVDVQLHTTQNGIIYMNSAKVSLSNASGSTFIATVFLSNGSSINYSVTSCFISHPSDDLRIVVSSNGIAQNTYTSKSTLLAKSVGSTISALINPGAINANGNIIVDELDGI
jgi:hypothetical protein